MWRCVGGRSVDYRLPHRICWPLDGGHLWNYASTIISYFMVDRPRQDRDWMECEHAIDWQCNYYALRAKGITSLMLAALLDYNYIRWSFFGHCAVVWNKPTSHPASRNEQSELWLRLWMDGWMDGLMAGWMFNNKAKSPENNNLMNLVIALFATTRPPGPWGYINRNTHSV